VDGRGSLIRDLVALVVASALIFAVDVFSPPTLVVSIAYAGVVLFALRPSHARLAIFAAVLASVLIGAALLIKGQFNLALSDAMVSGLLSITLTWIVVMLGGARFAQVAPTAPEPVAAEAVAQSHADIVKLTEEQRALLDRMNLATQTAGLVVWDRDLIHDSVFLDDSFSKLFGLRSATRGWEDIRDVIHPDDLQRVEDARLSLNSDPSAPVGT